MDKRKRKKDKQRSTKHTHKTFSKLISHTTDHDFHLIKLLMESRFMTSFNLNKW